MRCFCCPRCYATGRTDDEEHGLCGHVGGLQQAAEEEKERKAEKTCCGECDSLRRCRGFGPFGDRDSINDLYLEAGML